MACNIERKRLIIRFKPGLGDFGTGNAVHVEIEPSAFVEPIHTGNQKFSWSISTDVLTQPSDHLTVVTQK